MFYEKNHSFVFIICLGILIGAGGFLGGYFVSGYRTSHAYQEKETAYAKQIDTLKSQNKAAQLDLEKTQEKLKLSQTELARQKNQMVSQKIDDETNVTDAGVSLNENHVTDSAPTSQPETSQYLLKLYKGKPTVFDYTDGKEGDIVTIINTDIASLGTNDLAMLKKGIVIDSDEQLAQTLEDYSS